MGVSVGSIDGNTAISPDRWPIPSIDFSTRTCPVTTPGLTP